MVKINLIGFKELEKKLKDAPKEIQKNIGRDVSNAALLFQELAIKDAPVGVGSFLRGGITIKDIGPIAKEVVSSANYSAYVEFGTKKKFRPIPGIDASVYQGKTGGSAEDALKSITNWARLKGIKFQSAATFKSGKKKGQNKILTAEQTGWIIFHFIMLNGINPHPFFFKQIAPVRKKLIDDVEKTLSEL